MQIEHSNEVDLIRQTLAGDTAAFDRLVKAHRTTVYALVLSYTKNPADAEDLTQRIFIRAYEQLATLREWDCFLPWLQRITHNTCKDWLRRQSDSTTNFEAVNDADFAETASSPEEIVLKREVEAAVREAISALQETDRKLVEGRYIEGASYDQLQAESGLSYAAIANRLKRAKQQLRRRIERLLGGMAILQGQTLIRGGIETVKLSAKTKLAMVGVVAVLGIGGGVWYHHTFESNPVVVNEQRVSEPESVTETSTETEQASSPKSITAEEREQLDAAIAWLKALDEVEGRAEPSEAQDGNVEQTENGDVQNGDESDDSIPARRLRDEKLPPPPESTKEVLDVALWPAYGSYYISDILLYRPEILDSYADPALARAQFGAALAEDPYATTTKIDPSDPASGCVVHTADGRVIPGYIYFSDEYKTYNR